MTLIFPLLVFLASLVVLVKSSEYFTESAEKVGYLLHMPAFLIGITIVALGTSLPELASSVVAVLEGSSEMVIGNVVGSNIFNILLILGIGAIIGRHLKTGEWEIVHVDLPLIVIASFLLFFMAVDGVFTLFEAIISVAGLGIYLFYVVSVQKHHKSTVRIKKRKFDFKALVVLIVSAVFLYFGAKYTISSLVELSQLLNVGTTVLAAVALATGTSLPELMVTVSAVRRKKHEIAVGNVLGSNIFNTFAVMGIPALIAPLAIPSIMVTLGVPVMLAATILFFFVAQDKEITRWEGMFLVLFYILVVVKLLGLGF